MASKTYKQGDEAAKRFEEIRERNLEKPTKTVDDFHAEKAAEPDDSDAES